MKKYALSLLALTMALSSGAASAAGAVGSPVVAETNVIFQAANEFAHALTPVTGLASGLNPSTKMIATGNIVLSAATSNKMRLDWVSGVDKSTPLQREISGNTATNKITVYFTAVAGDTATTLETIGNTSSVLLSKATSTTMFNYQINLLSGITVAPDTYKIQVKAQSWEA
ncbi:hypothetical protein [Aeromonas popoffii]|uniref:hypothetical protein n=1 Tax=Aeromonas popoffii TaxID=70856 RepID=UPI0030D430AA